VRVGFTAAGTAGDTIAIRQLADAAITTVANAHFVVTSTGTAGHSENFIIPVDTTNVIEYMVTSSTGATATICVLGYQYDI
jgi:acetolactate synthase small subunit